MLDRDDPLRPTAVAPSILKRARGGSLKFAFHPSSLWLLAIFWTFAFLISSATGELLGHLPFRIAGGHAAAAFLFGAAMALAFAVALDVPRPGSKEWRLLLAGGVILMPLLHAVFFSLACKIAPIPGVPPMTHREIVVKALLSGSYFVAWMGLHLALTYRKRADLERRSPSERLGRHEAARSPASFWASRGNLRIRVLEEEIVWIEAQKDYVILHSRAGNAIMRATLSSIEAALDSSSFIRIHRSAIVRRSSITAVQRCRGGALAVVTAEAGEIPVGRSYARGLKSLVDRLDVPSA